MFKLIKSADDYLVEEVSEPVAQGIYNAIGKDVFWSCLLFVNLYLAFSSLDYFIKYPGQFGQEIWYIFFSWVFISGSAGFAKNRYKLRPGMANPIRRQLRIVRVIYALYLTTVYMAHLLFFVAGVIIGEHPGSLTLLEILGDMSYLASIYMLSCSLLPRPPKRYTSMFGQTAPAAWRG